MHSGLSSCRSAQASTGALSATRTCASAETRQIGTKVLLLGTFAPTLSSHSARTMESTDSSSRGISVNKEIWLCNARYSI